MHKINIAICDDDTFFNNLFKEKLEDIISTSIDGVSPSISSFTSGKDLLDNFSSDYSVCFLDVCIDKENGIDIGIKLKEAFPHVILVFVTSFIEFSLEGYKANAFRYLLKDSVLTDKNEILSECITDIFKQLSLDRATLSLLLNGSEVTIKVNSIMYIESFSHTQIVHMTDSQSFECHMSLSDFEQKLTEMVFIKPHKSFLVNFKYIDKIKNNNLFLKDGTVIPIAKNKNAEFKKEFMELLSCK